MQIKKYADKKRGAEIERWENADKNKFRKKMLTNQRMDAMMSDVD